jgi:hypothetical protein
VPERSPLRTPYADADAESDVESAADAHAESDAESDTHPDHTESNSHARPERVLPVCQLLRGADQRDVRGVRRGAWGVLYKRVAVRRSHADAHPDAAVYGRLQPQRASYRR